MKNAPRFVALAVSALSLLVLAGCSTSESVDTSKGGYGKADTTTQLPPQPNPEDVAKSRAANPQGGPVGPQK